LDSTKFYIKDILISSADGKESDDRSETGQAKGAQKSLWDAANLKPSKTFS
jgi:hypothetical protein